MSEIEERSNQSGSGMDRTDSASGESACGSVKANSSSAPSASTESSHSHVSSMKMSTCGASAASDSAYGGSNSQSQRSGSGSRSSKSQNSSISSNNAAAEQPKRKDKEPKKRKSKAFILPTSAVASASSAQNGSQADQAAGAAANNPGNSNAASTAASTAVASCCGNNTVEESTNAGSKGDESAASGHSHGHSGTATSSAFTLGARQKKSGLSGSRSGIRAVTESRQLQAAALSRALNSLQGTGLSKESMSSCSARDDGVSSSWRSLSTDPAEVALRKAFAHLEEEPSVKAKDAFIAGISLEDGAVVYVTSSLTERLGYPSEMWLKRSLLDFLHPKDRLTFTNQITSKLLTGIDSSSKDDSSRYSFSSGSGEGSASATSLGMFGSTTYPCNTLCCRLRMYRGLRTSGFGIVDKKTSYVPYRITLMLEKIAMAGCSSPDLPVRTESGGVTGPVADPQVQNRQKPTDPGEPAGGIEDPCDPEPDSSEFYLLAYATPISSAYKGPEEKNPTGQFGLRHSSTCQFSEVDLGSVPYLGHLPQDLLGASALDFYHPNDLAELKNVYHSVIGRQGKSVRSKPYHFRAFNGCYVLLETDWTCFVNPWTKKLEFVAGRHRVLRGPSNPDVFAQPPEGASPPSANLDPVAAENAKKLHAEISNLLSGSARPSANQPSQAQAQAQQHGSSSRAADSELLEAAACRRKRLAALMGTLIEEVVKVKGSNSCGNSCGGSCSSHLHSHCHSPAEGSLLGDASVVMGDISTHGGSRTDSNSADTPLSYSQLNYNQNLDRYFQSQPKMMPSEGSGEGCSGSALSADSKEKSKHGRQMSNPTPNMSSEEEGGLCGTRESGSAHPSNSQQLSSSKSNSNSHSRTSDSQNEQSTSTAGEYKGLPLTKEMLARHNEEMEKEFMQQHRELRNRSSHAGRRSGHGHASKEPHGVKRGQASSWEEGPGCRHKQPHIDGAADHSLDCSPDSSPRTPYGRFNEWTSSLTGPTIIPVNLLPPFSVSVTPSNPPTPAVFTATHNSAGVRSSPATPVSVTNTVPGVLPAYYLPAGGGGRMTANTVPSIPMGAPLFVPQPTGSYPLQPFSYLPGIIYQPVMVPPMVFQPNAIGQASHPSYNRSVPRQRQPDYHRRHHRSGNYTERPGERNPNSQPSRSNQSEQERHLQSLPREETAAGMRISGRDATSHHAHSHRSTATGAQSEATSLRAELGSRAASYVSASAPWPPTANSMSTFHPQQQSWPQPQSNAWSPLENPNSCLSDLSASGWQSTPDNGTQVDGIERRPHVKKTPPWMESIAPTAEFVYQYQVPGRTLTDVLQQDRERLQLFQQPGMLNDQLFQLYTEMEAEQRVDLGFELEEGETTTTSSSSAGSENSRRQLRRRVAEFRQTMLYEENAPFPKPAQPSNDPPS